MIPSPTWRMGKVIAPPLMISISLALKNVYFRLLTRHFNSKENSGCPFIMRGKPLCIWISKIAT
jgi:hypothetical protein